MIRCAICGREITEPAAAWKRMSGWVSPRGAKGMTQTSPTGELAHAECVTAMKQGVVLGQESLV